MKVLVLGASGFIGTAVCARLAEQAVATRTALPPAYHRIFWTWFAFGFPAFAAVLAIFWLMIARPSFPLWS